MEQVIPSAPLAILGAVVVVVFGGLVWLLKYLLSEALPHRDKEQQKLLEAVHGFYEKQFQAEREICQDSQRKILEEQGRVALILQKILEKLHA